MFCPDGSVRLVGWVKDDPEGRKRKEVWDEKIAKWLEGFEDEEARRVVCRVELKEGRVGGRDWGDGGFERDLEGRE